MLTGLISHTCLFLSHSDGAYCWEGGGLICVINVLNKDARPPRGWQLHRDMVHQLATPLPVGTRFEQRCLWPGLRERDPTWLGACSQLTWVPVELLVVAWWLLRRGGGTGFGPWRCCWLRLPHPGGDFHLSGPCPCWASGAKPTSAPRVAPGSLIGDLCGGWCFRLFLEITLVGEASPHKGPLLDQQLPPPGRGGWKPPRFAAASTYFEQEEQKCQSSMLPVRRPGSPHTPLFRVMLLRDGAVVWEGGGSLCPAGWQEQGCPGGPAIPPERPQWGFGTPQSLTGFLAPVLFSSWTPFLLPTMIKKDVLLCKMPLPQHWSRENYSLQLHWQYRRIWQIKPEFKRKKKKTHTRRSLYKIFVVVLSWSFQDPWKKIPVLWRCFIWLSTSPRLSLIPEPKHSK